MRKFILIKKENIEKLPKECGVYSFYENKKILYIGKAKNIKERVKEHFKQIHYKDAFLTEKVNIIGYIKTSSEIEALILESCLIKQYQPKYNVMWRDDKNYFWIEIKENKEGIPYIKITHQKNNQSKKILGPFTEGGSLKKTLRWLRKIFPYYTTKKHPQVKCLYCHLGLCPGPYPDIEKYKKDLKKLVDILNGKKKKILLNLKKEMMLLAKKERFEEAARVRDKLFALNHILKHARILEYLPLESENDFQIKNALKELSKVIGLKKIPQIVECYDISNIQGKEATGSMIVSINGKIKKNLYKRFKIRNFISPNDPGMLKEILERRLAHKEWPYPDIILLDGGKTQLNAILQFKKVYPQFSKIKIIALAKPKKELWIENKTKALSLKKLSPSLVRLLIQLNNEAHRFALSYHKNLRKKVYLTKI